MTDHKRASARLAPGGVAGGAEPAGGGPPPGLGARHPTPVALRTHPVVPITGSGMLAGGAFALFFWYTATALSALAFGGRDMAGVALLAVALLAAGMWFLIMHQVAFLRVDADGVLTVRSLAPWRRPAAARATIRHHAATASATVDERAAARASTQTSKTRIVTRDVDVTVSAFYKHSRVKEYLKDGRALRVEAVVNSPTDLGCQ